MKCVLLSHLYDERMVIAIDTKLLKRVIDDSGLKKKTLCDALGCTYATLRAKVNGRSDFTASEMFRLCDVLSINGTTARQIFFTNKGEYIHLGSVTDMTLDEIEASRNTTLTKEDPSKYERRSNAL